MTSFLSLFTATDSSFVSAAKYRLYFLGSPLTHQTSWVCGIITEFIFYIYLCIAVPANALLGLVLSAGSWLAPLSDLYQRFTGPLYEVFPPWLIAMGGLAIVVTVTLRAKPSTTKGDLFDSDALNRLGVAAAMVALVAILASNPFQLITWVLETTNGLATDFASKVTGSGNGTPIETGQALVDQSIRAPAIALNYGRGFSADCSNQWSLAMDSGQSGGLGVDSGCFVPGQDEATPGTPITAAIMLLFPAVPMLVFSVIASWKYVVHLSMAVLMTVSTAWVGALKVHHRRGFDAVAEHVARAAAHMIMAVFVSGIAVVLPSLSSGIAMQVLGDATGMSDDGSAQVFLMMVTLGVGFIVSTLVLLRLTSNQSALVRVLKADAKTTLEATLGVKPQKLTTGNYGLLKFNPFARQDADATEGKGKQAAAAAAAPKDGGAGAGAEAEGEGVGSSRVRDEDAVKALTATAAAVAEQLGTADVVATLPAGAAAAAAGTASESAQAEGAPSNRVWQTWVQKVSSAVTINRVGDVYGYFTESPPEPVPDEREVIDAEIVEDYGDQSRAAQLSAGQPELPAPSDPVLQAPGPAEPTPPAPTSGGFLAAVAPRTLEPPVTTAGGNVYADTELGAAASAVGATFTTDVPAPVAVTVAAPLPGFSGPRRGGDDAVASSVQHGPAVVVFDGVEVQVPSSSPPSGQVSPPVNDQQRWNRARFRFSAQVAPEAGAADVTSSPAGSDLPPSGIFSGVNRHPASFVAPMPDFLAADELLAQKEEVELVGAAVGRPVVALAPDGDLRLSLRLSSDPDERVVRVCDSQFGDPL